MKKKVLIISYSYPPSNAPAAQRPYAIAKYLDQNEFDVTVVTCKNPDSSLGFNQNFDPELENVKLIKINSLIGGGASTLRKSKMEGKKSLKNKVKSFIFDVLSSMIVPDRVIFWYNPVKKFLLKNEELIYQSDIVFTTSPAFSNHLIGRFIKSRNKDIHWVSEFRDFHFLEHHQFSKNLKYKINRKLEHSIIKNSDKISFISYAMRDIYANYYTDFKDKFRVIYNGFDMSDFKDLKIERTQNKKLTIFYAGSFYRGVRSPIPLLKILDYFIENGKIATEEIEIRIAGNFEADLLDEIKNFKSFESINFIGNIPRTKVLEHLVSADLLWLIVGNKSTHYTGVPIKFFEYLGARRPMINFAPAHSEPTRLIAKNNLGWSFDTSNFDLETAAGDFKEIIEKYRSGVLSESLKKQFLPEFDREHQGTSFANLFQEK